MAAETLSGIAGFAAVEARARRVWALFVDPNCEGAGVGRALHDAMLAWCREQGLQRLFLSTEAGSRAVRFYTGAGWTQTGVTADGGVLFEKICSANVRFPPISDILSAFDPKQT